MKKFSLFFFVLFSFALYSNPLDMMSGQQPQHILVHNRILAKINGKTISLIDVMKRMNVLINRHLPHIMQSKVDTYRFYMTNWRDTLTQMIDHELILADAERAEVTINDADIRETLQERFGPNVISTLNQLNLSLEEARELIQTELTVQRMTWYRINAKAVLTVNPKDIKTAYRSRLETSGKEDEWKYQVLTISSNDTKKGEDLSETAFALLQNSKSGLIGTLDELKNQIGEENLIQVSISPEYAVNDRSLSEAHKSILVSLREGDYSKPVTQIRRSDNSTVHRIFHLKEHVKKEPPTFRELADQLQDELVQSAVSKESESYIAKLRQRFGFDDSEILELIKSNFQPFTLQ